jgi:hypothetical protein
VRVAPGTDGMLLGAINVEVDGASPRPADDAGGLLQDWVMRGTNISALGRATPGDVTPAPGSSGAVGPRVSRLLLLGFPGFSPSPIDWR